LNNRSTLIAITLLTLFIGGSLWLVFEYAARERSRDLEDWQGRLGIMAESQQRSVETWFDKQVDDLTELANNPLLQLYASQQSDAEFMADETSHGQLQHLRNLINATADKSAVFTPINKINHNAESRINDGIAIVNAQGVLLATRYFPVDDIHIGESYLRALKQRSAYITNIYDADTDKTGVAQPRFIIVVPIVAVQAMSKDDFRAAVVAVINPTDNLFKLLLKEWVATQTEETLLVSLEADSLAYLSPLKNGYEIFHKQVRDQADDNFLNAEAVAAESIGQYVMQGDYRSVQVIETARAVRNTSMVLVQKLDAGEALAESKVHQEYILTVLLLAVFIIAISFIAIWRHATSLRLQKAKRRLEARTALLNAVSDSINDHIFLLDHKKRLVFINDALARAFSIDNVDIRGKALNHIFDTDIMRQLLAVKPRASDADVRNKEMRLAINNKRHDFHVSVVGLNHVDYKQSQLYVLHDITELKDAQGKHHRLMDGIISTLAQVIDKHDPHCEFHSQRTREVAVAIARAMKLSQDRIDALSMAALLANIGKLYIPAEVLTNVEPLTEEESLMLRQNTSYSVEILQGLEFDGPVIEFVQQKNEYLDGSGYPAGTSGEAIHLESRILSVANAFVAMTSSRAYRAGKPIDEVLEIFLSEADRHYDRRVIAALFHLAENYSDWASWQQVTQP